MTTVTRRAPQPTLADENGPLEQLTLYLFVIVPFLALLASVPVAWGWGLGWVDIALFFFFYTLTGHGITVGYHRYFTHGSFRAATPVRVGLAIAGSMAIQGPVLQWVADHRRHHAFSDKQGDPHSPWRFGTSTGALVKGMFYAHLGWLFEHEQTNRGRYAPDLIRDDTLRRTSDLFVLWAGLSVALPAVLGGLLTWSWAGALSGFFWAGLVRVCVLHHVTWSINSICHTIGSRPFAVRDKSANFWPLAILSMGESWHNSHHADPTAARHGVLRGQLDSSARVIWLAEKLGWVTEAKWPSRERIAAKLVGTVTGNDARPAQQAA
ncbi:acyl-CoA desaturase [soil metagenome]